MLVGFMFFYIGVYVWVERFFLNLCLLVYEGGDLEWL